MPRHTTKAAKRPYTRRTPTAPDAGTFGLLSDYFHMSNALRDISDMRGAVAARLSARLPSSGA